MICRDNQIFYNSGFNVKTKNISDFCFECKDWVAEKGKLTINKKDN